MGFYKYFLDSTPYYLARHDWWAYLWRPMTWFFDHQPVINAILFGQYKKLMQATLEKLDGERVGRLLQLSCVYGCLTPSLAERVAPQALHITDVSTLQLQRARRKVPSLRMTRMNAEHLAYQDDGFDTVVLFFLLHEMPEAARRHVLAEAARILAPGGRLLLTEYGPLPKQHLLYRFPLSRWLLTTLEPFLNGFWREDRTALLQALAGEQGKQLEHRSSTELFSGFYRVDEYRLHYAR